MTLGERNMVGTAAETRRESRKLDAEDLSGNKHVFK